VQSIDRVRRWQAAEEAVRVGYPPVLDCKLYDVFFPLVVDGIFAEAAGIDEGNLFADVAFLKKELPLPDSSWSEELRAEGKLLVSEVDSLVDMCAEEVEHE